MYRILPARRQTFKDVASHNCKARRVCGRKPSLNRAFAMRTIRSTQVGSKVAKRWPEQSRNGGGHSSRGIFQKAGKPMIRPLSNVDRHRESVAARPVNGRRRLMAK